MSIFDDVLQKQPEDGGTPDGNIFGSLSGGPTMDRTATDDWRSTYTNPVNAQLTHEADLASATPNYVTKGPPRPFTLPDIAGGVSSVTSGIQNWANTAPVLGGALSGIDNVFGTLQKPGQWLADRFNIPSQDQQAYDMAKVQASVLRGKGATPTPQEVESTKTFSNAILGYQAVPHAEAPRVTAADIRPRALPEPAIPMGGARPAEVVPTRAIPARLPVSPRQGIADAIGGVREPVQTSVQRSVIDTTARELTPEEKFRAQIQASLDRQKANPTPTNELGNRHPVSERDPGAVAPITLEQLNARTGGTQETFADRVGKLRPVGREDLTLGPKVNTVPPVPISDLRARIGSDQWQPNVPLDAEQLAARIGATSPAQRAVADNLKTQVAAREAQAAEPRQATGTLGASGMSGPLVGRAIGRGSSQLARTGLKSEGLTASPGDLSASLARQAKVHDANEAAIAAAKSGDTAALERAKADVKLLGGDLTHTDSRIARSQRVTTNETTTQDFQASIDALKQKQMLADTTKAAPKGAASSLAPRIARIESELSRSVGSPSPQEVARALDAEAARIMSQDVRSLPKRGLIGTRSLQGTSRDAGVLQSEAQRAYGSGLARGSNAYRPDASRASLEGRVADLKTVANGIREQLRVIRDAEADIIKENKASKGAQPWTLSAEDRMLAEKSPGFRSEMGLREPDPKVIADAEARIAAAKEQIKQHLADAEEQGVKTPTAALADKFRNGLRGLLKEEGGSATVGGALHGIGSDLLRPNVSRIAENVAGTGKTLTTAMSPFHFMFRHALPFMAAHPAAWLKGGVEGLGEGFTMTPAKLDARITQMHDNLTRNGLGNVYLGKPHLGAIGGEESVASNWLTKLGPLGSVIQRSGQGFTQGLNEVRYEAAKGAVNSSEWMAKHGLAQRMNFADRRAIGDAINHFSGRGLDTANMGDTGKAAMRLLNVPMFSPQLATARVRMLGDFANGLQEITGDLAHGRAPRADAIERARLGVGYITGVGALYLLMKAATGNGPDLNPVSSTFGQVDAGDRGPAQAAAGFLAPELGMGFNSYDKQPSRVDPTASESTLVRNIARLALSIYDRASGQSNLKKLTGNQQEQSPVDVATSAIVSQIFTSPIGYPIAEWLRGYGVEPLDSITPMPITGALKGAGVQMPTVGGKETKTTGSTTPRTGPAPTRKPVKR